MQVFTCKQSGISAANAAMATSVAPHQQPAPPTPNNSLSAATSNPPMFTETSADALSMPPTVGQPNESPIAATPKLPPKMSHVAAPKSPPVAAPKPPPVAAPKSLHVAAPKSPPVAAPKSPTVAAPKSPPVAAPKPKLPTVAAPSALLASVHKSPTVVARTFSTVDEPKSPTIPVLEEATVGSFPVPQQAEMV